MLSSNFAWRIGKTQTFKLNWFKKRTFYIGGWCDLLGIGSILDLLNRFLMTTANSWHDHKTIRQRSFKHSVPSARTPSQRCPGASRGSCGPISTLRGVSCSFFWLFFLSLLLLLLLAKNALVLPFPEPPCKHPSLLVLSTSGMLFLSTSYLLRQEHRFPPRLSVRLHMAPLTRTYTDLQLACLTPFWRQFSSKTWH